PAPPPGRARAFDARRVRDDHEPTPGPRGLNNNCHPFLHQTRLHVTGMQNFTAWVHGDASARLLGAEPVGLPTGAGYAAGIRLVRAYLDATGATAAQSIAVPVDEVLRVAAPQLGLRLNREE